MAKPDETNKGFRTYTEPERAKNAKGDDQIPVCRVYEPWAWNQKLLDKQRSEGREDNIPQVPGLGRTHTMTTKEPKQIDLRKVAQEKSKKNRGIQPGETMALPVD